ncbi:MAG: terminase small subunit, partial [Candidatus Aminicenantes bacterium]|nr:terminase small subunit [Candidatus Aminicenantes bacterium]
MNATQAAIRAGYSEKTANEQGSRLLVNVSIQNRVQQGVTKRSEKVELTADEVMWELRNILKSDIKNYVDIDPNTGAIRAKGFDEMPEGTSRVYRRLATDIPFSRRGRGGQRSLNKRKKRTSA